METLLALMLLAAIGPNAAAGEKPAMRFVAVIKEYRDFAAEDFMEGGNNISYATATLRILTPRKYKDREFSVMEEMPVSPQAVLRKVGRKVFFKMKATELEGQGSLFIGPLTDLKLVP